MIGARRRSANGRFLDRDGRPQVIRRLRLEDAGGLVRVGLCHYNTPAEVDRLIAALREL